jgi:hypothetical protein
MALISIALMLIFVICFSKNKIHTGLVIYLLFSVLIAISENQWNVKNNSERNYLMIDKTADFFSDIAIADDIGIYYGMDSYGGRLRVALYDKNMTFLNDNALFATIDYDNSILLTQQEGADKKYGFSAECLKLDEYEYIYTNNENIISMVKEWQLLQIANNGLENNNDT